MGNLTDSFPAATSSNILEIIQGSADGRSITVGSGTYTLQNVTAYQTGSTSYADITGSSISYIPPADTKYILYHSSINGLIAENEQDYWQGIEDSEWWNNA